MGGGGSIAAMLATLKNNKIPPRTKLKGHKNRLYASKGDKLIFKNKLKTTELLELRKKLEAEQKSKMVKSIWFYTISFLVFAFGVWYFIPF